MVSVTVELRNIEDTQAAIGWGDGHTVVVDRPKGKAGGQGLGFNGAQLLGLAVGGCFYNDLRYIATEMGIGLEAIAISVHVDLEDNLRLTKTVTMTVSCQTLDGSDPQPIIDRARAVCMVKNSLEQGVPVAVELGR